MIVTSFVLLTYYVALRLRQISYLFIVSTVPGQGISALSSITADLKEISVLRVVITSIIENCILTLLDFP